MRKALTALTRRLHPNYDALSGTGRRYAVMTVAVMLYAVPLALGGLVWLTLATSPATFRQHWPVLLLLLALVLLFRRFVLFLTVEITPGFYLTTSTTFENIVTWSAVLIFGPVALWLEVIGVLVYGLRDWRTESDPEARRDQLRNLALGLASGTVPWLVALSLYLNVWGGALPLADFSLAALRPAVLAAGLQVVLIFAIQFPLMAGFALITARQSPNRPVLRLLAGSWALWYGLGLGVAVATVFVAALYMTSGPGVYLFFVGNALVASFVASRLSHTTELSRQRSRELEQLEQLGRALLDAPLDGANLSALLAEHLPGMFSYSFVEICHFEDGSRYRVLVREPDDPAEWAGVPADAWAWIAENPAVHSFTAGHVPPWGGERLTRHTLLVPLAHPERGEREHSAPIFGGLLIARRSSRGPASELLPAAQTLAAQIASALHRAEAHEEVLAHARTMRELQIAGEIQATFLPDHPPEIEGWELAGALRSAHETSGDFFDWIPMWDGRLGVVVADVADKGIGAAIYMALARTLIRTYAVEYSTRYPDSYAFHPERVLNTVNQCILNDTRSDLFVTVFFGIIDPKLATLTYANAGHDPPLLCVRDPQGGRMAVRGLVNTGIPLGIQDFSWERGSVPLAHGDMLFMYTDGLTEAENERREMFGSERLLDALHDLADRPADDVQQAITRRVRTFMGAAPLHDDITLLVVRRTFPEPPGQP